MGVEAKWVLRPNGSASERLARRRYSGMTGRKFIHVLAADPVREKNLTGTLADFDLIHHKGDIRADMLST
jgi:hypothetical protein